MPPTRDGSGVWDETLAQAERFGSGERKISRPLGGCKPLFCHATLIDPEATRESRNDLSLASLHVTIVDAVSYTATPLEKWDFYVKQMFFLNEYKEIKQTETKWKLRAHRSKF